MCPAATCQGRALLLLLRGGQAEGGGPADCLVSPLLLGCRVPVGKGVPSCTPPPSVFELCILLSLSGPVGWVFTNECAFSPGQRGRWPGRLCSSATALSRVGPTRHLWSVN